MGDEAWLDPVEVERYVLGNAAAREALGLAKDACIEAHLLARGEYNANFRFRCPGTQQRLLFRVNLGSQMGLDDQIGYEARALSLLEASGRTPRVLFVDATKAYFGKGILVEQWLPGRALDYATDLPIAAQVLADVHAVPLPPDHGLVKPADAVGSIAEECAAMFGRYRAWSGANRTVVQRIDRMFSLVESAKAPTDDKRRRHVVSTELNSQNFLVNEGAASYLVDWEKPVAGEVEQDLAHFLVPTTTYWKTDTLLNAADIDRFVASYVDAVAGRFSVEGLRERVNDYLAVTCLRGLTWCAMAYADHVSGVRSVADDFTFAKVEEYLTDEFLTFVEREYFGL